MFARSIMQHTPPTRPKSEQSWILRVHFPDVAEVCVSGDFNHWRTPGAPMELIGPDQWEIRLALGDPSGSLGEAKCFGFRSGRGLYGAVPVQSERFELGQRVVRFAQTPRVFQVVAHHPA